MPIRLIAAESKDVEIVLQFIHELADYEKLLHTITATKEVLLETMFRPNSVAKAIIAWVDDKPAGMALYFYNFSTFTGRPGIYLEDLFVREQYRKRGIGKMFFKHLARIAVQEKCTRFEWAVLDWNQLARDFYKRMGAVEGPEWILNRVTGDSLIALSQMEI